jgi:homocitrate synthase NifV
MKTIRIIDSTLRDGLQAPSFFLTEKEKVRTASILLDSGVDEIELSAYSTPEGMDVLFVKGEDRFLGWSRALTKDLQEASEKGFTRMHAAFPVSDILLTMYGKSESALFLDLVNCLKTMSKLFSFFSIGFIDAFRAPVERVQQLALLCQSYDAGRVRFSDTVGSAYPWQISKLVDDICTAVEIPVEIHAHNDFGLALANSLSAIRAGATAVSATVGGIGERAGNCRLEELAFNMNKMGEFATGLNTESILELDSFFQSKHKYRSDYMRPLNGNHVYTHASGIHGHGISLKEKSFCEVDPKIAKSRHLFNFSEQSGRHMVVHAARQLGLMLNYSNATEILHKIKKRSRYLHRSLTEFELKEMVKDFYEFKNR